MQFFLFVYLELKETKRVNKVLVFCRVGLPRKCFCGGEATGMAFQTSEFSQLRRREVGVISWDILETEMMHRLT